MFCFNCGGELSDDQAFCPKCGSPRQNNADTIGGRKKACRKRGFRLTRPEDAISTLGCFLMILAVFLPMYEFNASFIVEFSGSVSYMSSDVKYVGLLSLVPTGIALVMLLFDLRILFLIISLLDILPTVILSQAISEGVKESFGTYSKGTGYYMLIVGTVVLVAGAILKLVRKEDGNAAGATHIRALGQSGLSQSISNGISSISEKTNDFLEENRLKTQISTLEDNMNSTYMMIGGRFYDRWKEGDTSTDLEEFSSQMEDLKRNELLIAGQRARIEELHAKI